MTTRTPSEPGPANAVAASDADATAGAAPGFRPGRTLPVRVELRRQLLRMRTRVMLGFCAGLPLLLIVAFQLGDDGGGGSADLIGLATRGALNFLVFTLVMAVGFVLVVIVALCFGDTIASEASWSSLKYLLAIPVPRGRLLLTKAIVAAILAVTAILTLAVTAYVLGALRYGMAPMTTPFGDEIPQSTSFSRLALGLGYIVVSLSWVAGLALLLSVCTNAPLGAVGGAVMASIVVQILDAVTALGTLRNWLPGHFTGEWTRIMNPTINWDPLLSGVFSSLAYFLVFAVAAALVFRDKDITS